MNDAFITDVEVPKEMKGKYIVVNHPYPISYTHAYKVDIKKARLALL